MSKPYAWKFKGLFCEVSAKSQSQSGERVLKVNTLFSIKTAVCWAVSHTMQSCIIGTTLCSGHRDKAGKSDHWHQTKNLPTFNWWENPISTQATVAARRLSSESGYVAVVAWRTTPYLMFSHMKHLSCLLFVWMQGPIERHVSASKEMWQTSLLLKRVFFHRVPYILWVSLGKSVIRLYLHLLWGNCFLSKMRPIFRGELQHTCGDASCSTRLENGKLAPSSLFHFHFLPVLVLIVIARWEGGHFCKLFCRSLFCFTRMSWVKNPVSYNNDSLSMQESPRCSWQQIPRTKLKSVFSTPSATKLQLAFPGDVPFENSRNAFLLFAAFLEKQRHKRFTRRETSRRNYFCSCRHFIGCNTHGTRLPAS